MISYQTGSLEPNWRDRPWGDENPIGEAQRSGTLRLCSNASVTHPDDAEQGQSHPPKAITVHIVDENQIRRAQIARLAFTAGLHAEIYADCNEFVQFSQRGGIILCFVASGAQTVSGLLSSMAERGDWLPIIAFSEALDASCIVNAIKMGAIDYLQWPLDVTPFRQAIDSASSEAQKIHKLRSQEAEATLLVNRLSPRERQVLCRLAGGQSNKAIARDLDLSPRTVEIHRMKMMSKLGAQNAAEALRLWILAKGFESSVE
jgi:FixJ family two-component response regulator